MEVLSNSAVSGSLSMVISVDRKRLAVETTALPVTARPKCCAQRRSCMTIPWLMAVSQACWA